MESPAATESAPENALKSLLFDESDKEHADRLAKLGYKKPIRNPKQRGKVADIHANIAVFFNAATETLESDPKVFGGLCQGAGQKDALQYLLAQSWGNRTVLHTVLDPGTYDKDRPVFDKIKPLLRCLLKICPELPGLTCYDGEVQGTALYAFVLSPESEKQKEDVPDEKSVKGGVKQESPLQHEILGNEIAAKEDIVRFFCSGEPAGLGSGEAIKSLTTRTRNDDSPGQGNHAIHRAIANSVKFDEDLVKKIKDIKIPTPEDKNKQEKPCLEVFDNTGKTCLHLALSRPFTPVKRRWARMLIDLNPDLLKIACRSSKESERLTPLQHFVEERKKARVKKEGTSGKGKKDTRLPNPLLKVSGKERLDDNALKLSAIRRTPTGLGQKRLGEPRAQKPDKWSDDPLSLDPDKDLEDELKLCCLVQFDNNVARSIMYPRNQSLYILTPFS